MEYILIALVLLGFTLYGCKKAADRADNPLGISVKADDIKNASEDKIRVMLAGLKNTKAPPKREVFQAMCYDVAAPPEYVEFICPLDGEKTLYTYNEGSYGAELASKMPQSARRLSELAKDKNITFTVDITQFCKKHYPDLKRREPILIVTYKTGRVVKNPVALWQLALLESFFKGDKYYDEDSEPIQNRLPQIAELLGQDINAL